MEKGRAIRPISALGGDQSEEEDALVKAALDGDTNTVKKLLEDGVSTEAISRIPGKEGLTPLHLASMRGHTAVVKLLVDARANRKADGKGLRAVHYAAARGYVEVLQILWDTGCNIKSRTHRGSTPLHLAAATGNLAVVKWLVEKGAYINIKDKSGFTPEVLARKKGHQSVAKYLQEKSQEAEMNDLYDKMKLGEGSFGEVFRVKRHGRYLVLKSIKLSDMPRKSQEYAHQEIKLLRSLNNPYIVSYVGGGFKGQFLHIQMEYCGGGTLFDRIQQQKEKETFFDEQQAVNWSLRICLALKHIHKRNILHRDIKPHNIFLTSDGIIKLGDFGLSKALENDSAALTCLGSPAYMSPEVRNGEPYGSEADMWSFGCVMFEIAMLKLAFPFTKLDIPNYSQAYRDAVMLLLMEDRKRRPKASAILKLPIFHDILEIQLPEIEQDNSKLRQDVDDLSHEIEDYLSEIDRLNDEIKKLKGGGTSST